MEIWEYDNPYRDPYIDKPARVLAKYTYIEEKDKKEKDGAQNKVKDDTSEKNDDGIDK